MSIKFICSCGKRLRARDEMAGKRSVCPKCGMPVGIPFLKPTHPGGPLGHMTPAERLRHQSRLRKLDNLTVETASAPGLPVGSEIASAAASRPRTLSEELFPKPLDPSLVRVVGTAKRRTWELETRWYQCLWYPLRAWWLIVPMAAALSLLTAGTMFLLPEISKFRDNPLGIMLIAIPYLLLAGTILGYACSLPEGALISGMDGEFRYVRWPGRGVGLALRSCAIWSISFVAGPILFTAGSFVYWFYCGDPALVDWFILAELNIVGIAYALLALLAFCRDERLRDVNPWQVALLVDRLSHRVLMVILLAAALILVHGVLLIVLLGRLQHEAGKAWPGLFLCWLSGLVVMTFLLRLVGVWCYREAHGKNSSTICKL